MSEAALSARLGRLVDDAIWEWCERGRDPAEAAVLLTKANNPPGRALIEAAVDDVAAFEEQTKHLADLYTAVTLERSLGVQVLARTYPLASRVIEKPAERGRFWLLHYTDDGLRVSARDVPRAPPGPEPAHQARMTWRSSSKKRKKRSAGASVSTEPLTQPSAAWKDPDVERLADLGWHIATEAGTPAEDVAVAVFRLPDPVAVAFVRHAALHWRISEDDVISARRELKMMLPITRAMALEWVHARGEHMFDEQLARPPGAGGYWALILFGESIGLMRRLVPDRSRAELERRLERA